MSSIKSRVAAVAFLVLTACASEDDSDPPPAPETLFDTLPAASPDKLRGVWQSTQTQQNGTVEIRLRFMEKHLVGAAKCLAKGSDTPVLAGGSVGLDTSALDAATGKVTVGTLALQKQEGNLICQLSLQGNTYDFTIENGTLTLAVGNAKLNTVFTKVGD
jgi:hypothetical protein